MSLERIELQTHDQPDASVIWLHGLGADGHDFEAIVPELQLPDNLRLRFIFPHAPYRPITLNNGYVMRGWYDIASLDVSAPQDEDGITESSAAINALIAEEVNRGIEHQRIILAGFSQGGAVILNTGLSQPTPLAGLMALSTYLPPATQLNTDNSQLTMPIFMGHGLDDDIINYRYGVASRSRLQNAGFNIDWHDYAMGHSVCMQEIADIRDWLIRCLHRDRT